MFKNGVYMTGVAYTGSIGNSASDLTFADFTASTFDFRGILDQIRLYNRALYTGEIEASYNN